MGAARGVRLRAAAIWLLVALVAGTAVALYFAVVRALPAYTDGFQIPWWALAIAFAATEVFVIHAHFRGSAHTLSLSELPLVAGLLLATPQDLVIAQVVGPIVVLLFARGTAPVKVAFNVAQFALTATLSVIVLHGLVPAPAEIGPEVWTAVFLAVGAGSLVAAGLVVIEMRQRGDHQLRRHLTGGVPAHTVGECEQPRAGVDRIFVVGAHQAAVAAGGVAKDKGHGRSSITVLPM